MTPLPDETVEEVLDEVGVLERENGALRDTLDKLEDVEEDLITATRAVKGLESERNAARMGAHRLLKLYGRLPDEVREFLEKVSEG